MNEAEESHIEFAHTRNHSAFDKGPLDNRYNPTKPSRFARVIPAPAYAHCPKNNRVSRRAEHRAEVAARKAGVS